MFLITRILIQISPLLSLTYQPIQWVLWMDETSPFVVDPNMRYADIIVPTMDTVRASFIIELLLTNNKPVSELAHTSVCVLCVCVQYLCTVFVLAKFVNLS